MLGVALASSRIHDAGTYKLLGAGRYALDFKRGLYWIWVFPKWTSLGLLEEGSNPAVNLIARDKNGVKQGFDFIRQPGKYKNPYYDWRLLNYQDSKRHGYFWAWFDVKADGNYIVEYKTDRPCLLMFTPASAVHEYPETYRVIDGTGDDHLETPVVRYERR